MRSPNAPTLERASSRPGLPAAFAGALSAALVVWSAAGTAAYAQPVHVAADINRVPSDPSTNIQSPLAGTEHVYFSAFHPTYGWELWTSDSAVGGRLVADLCPGTCSSFPRPLATRGDELFLLADGRLWLSDGSNAGTRPFYTFCPSCGEGNLATFALLEERLFFWTRDPSSAFRLWSSDGTADGTAPLNIDFSGYQALDSMTVVGDRLFFFLYKDNDRSLWVSDGSTDGTFMVSELCDACGIPIGPFIAFEDRLVFQLYEPGFGNEPWVSDGTEAGTRRLADLAPGPDQTIIQDLVVWQDRLYGLSYVDCPGRCFFVSDGTPEGTRWAPEMEAPPSVGRPARIHVAGRNLFISIVPDGPDRHFSLWQVAPGGGAPARVASAPELVVRGTFGPDIIYQTRDTEPVGPVLYRFGSLPSRPQVLASIDTGWWIAAGSTAWLTAFADDTREAELWTSNGSAAGTVRRLDLTPPSSPSNPFDTRPWLDRALTRAFTDPSTGRADLWQVHAGGEQLVRQGPLSYLQAEAGGRVFLHDFVGDRLIGYGRDGSTVHIDLPSYPQEMVSHEDRLYVGAGSPGMQLWTAEPEDVSLQLLVDTFPTWSSGGCPILCPPPYPFATPVHLTPFGDQLLFVSFESEEGGPQLWATDGTAPGTRKIKEFELDLTRQYAPLDYPGPLVVAGPWVYFSATDGETGRELWISDGTTDGTRRLTDLVPGPGSASLTGLYAFGDRALGVEGTPDGDRLWLLAADEAPRRLLTELGDRVRIHDAVAAGGRAFVVAAGPQWGRELWVTQGDRSPAQRLDLLPGPRGSGAQLVAPLPDGVLFAADDGVTGHELWVTGGTPSTTRRVADIYSGPAPSSPGPGTVVGDRVYFPAEDGSIGRELFYLDLAELGPVGPPPCPDTRLCLQDGRFEVGIDWHTSGGATGPARRVASDDESGLLWFFSEDNWEAMVKVLDGCAINGHFWVFAAVAADVGFELEIVDTATGRVQVYANAPGDPAAAVTDVQALLCTP